MTGTPTQLTDKTGRVVFEGTQDGGGGSQPVATVVDEVLFSDFVAGPDPMGAWPGQAPFRTIAADQIILGSEIVVVEVFNDSGSASEIQVTDDPEGDGTQISTAPTPADLGISSGALWKVRDAPSTLHFWPKAGPLTPIVGLNAFNGDGTTGRALIFTTLYTPPA